MSQRFLLIGVFVLLILSASTAVFLWRCADDRCLVFNWQKARVVDSFERCAQLGFPVMESYPRQCAADGKTYVEQVAPLLPPAVSSIRVDAPLQGTTITSPFVVRGVAPGPWFFEASFPVKLFDEKGMLLVVTHADAKSDWMTTGLVPFEATLTFAPPQVMMGTLVLEKDNPSGLPQNAGAVSIPVLFGRPTNVLENGSLDGVMTIGPICPVERVDQPCLPTPEMYATHSVFVYTKDRQTLLATLTPDAQGEFHATLPVGVYYVDTTHQTIGKVDGVPTVVSIVAGQSTLLTIAVDAGIR
jgi:hypothetical protein